MTDGGDESLAEAFWGVAHQLRRRSMARLAEWDITPSQSRALSVLQRHPDVRPGGLAEHLRIAPRSATEVIDSLEERGLVERRPDPDDRRATLVTVTPAGTELQAEVDASRGAESEAIFAALSEADRAHLRRILRKLAG